MTGEPPLDLLPPLKGGYWSQDEIDFAKLWRESKSAYTLTADLSDRICEAIRAGVVPKAAALAHGVTGSKYMEWLRVYPDFAAAIAEAAGHAESEASKLAYAADPRWWLLHKPHTDDQPWGKKNSLDVKQETKIEAVSMQLDNLSLEELQQLRRLQKKIETPKNILDVPSDQAVDIVTSDQPIASE